MVVSVVSNAVVVAVMALRRKRIKGTHTFIVALAISDICLSLAIHPMLLATSFGVRVDELFTRAGKRIFSGLQ